MNYYERHLGDYAKDTAHLSMVEHGAYTLLLDRYYGTEQGIPADQVHRVARARTKEERAAVDAVLAEFFTLTDGVWVNRRAEEEIPKALQRINAAQVNGRKGGRPKKNPTGTQQKPSGLSLGSENETQAKAHQSPDTKQTPSDADASGGKPPASPASAPPPPTAKDIVFALGVPLLTAAGVKEANARSFLGMQVKAHGDAKTAEALQACADERAIDPVSWLQKRLGPIRTGAKAGKHAGFDLLDYHDGVTADGHLA